MQKVTVLAPAKINLALDVTGLTENGYHALDTIMQAVSLYEKIEISKSTGFSLRLPGSRVPAGPGNTATAAAEAFFYETGLLAGADITIHKKTPTRAGMGGGSADAAGVLAGLNKLYNAGLTIQKLCKIGARVGADVPFCLLGGTARATGIGDILTPLPPLPDCHIVIAMPRGMGVSTPAAFARYDEEGSPVHPDMEEAVLAVQQQDLEGLLPHIQNALEYTSGDKTTKNIRFVMQKYGALASCMTGSGAAVFGIFPNFKAAQKVGRILRLHAAQVFVTQPVPYGPRVS